MENQNESNALTGTSKVIEGTYGKVNPIMKYFEYEHLPQHLQDVSAPVCELAKKMDRELPENAEKEAGLRKLLEAKDCFVRSLVK